MPSVSQENPGRRRRPSFRERLDGWLERGILGIVLVILVWGPLAYGSVRVNEDSLDVPHLYGYLVIQGLVGLAVILSIFRFYTQQPFRLLWPPICWAVLAFVLYAIVRCQTAELQYAARQILQCVIVYAALFFVVVNNLNRRESASAVAFVLIAVGLGESLFAFYQYTSHYAQVWAVTKSSAYAVRGSGTYVNPDHFAGFVEMALPLALAYTVMGRVKATGKVVLGYCALVMMGGILFSQSRGGLVAAGVSLFVFCVVLVFQADYWRRGLVALGVLIVAGLVLMQQFGAVEARLDSTLFPANDGRVFYWKVAETIFHQHLWWGSGPGSFQYLYPEWANSWAQFLTRNAHNDYLTTLCEWGLVGFALVMMAVGLLVAGVINVWPYVTRGSGDMGGKNSSRAAFVLGASLAILAILIHSIVDFNMRIPANAVTCITLIALLTAHWRFGTERYWVNPRVFGKILLTLVAAGTVWFLAREGVRAGREFYWIEQGNHGTSWGQQSEWEHQVKALETAHEIDPQNFMTDYEIGEAHRLWAWQGDARTDTEAWQAAQWFARCMALNPYDYEGRIGYGKCLDWLNRPNEASKYFVQALMLNRHDARVLYEYAYHCMWLRNYDFAKLWLTLSLQVIHLPEAEAAMEKVNEKLAEKAQTKPAGR